MVNADELLDAARVLVAPVGGGPVSEGRLRRAVSTAYYALFHAVLKAAADRFIGADPSTVAGYSLIYRGFNHGRLKNVFLSVDVAKLAPTVAKQLGRPTVHQQLRECASVFVELQRARHEADYSPTGVFTVSYAEDMIELAALAMDALAAAPADQRTDLLALMLVQTRD